MTYFNITFLKFVSLCYYRIQRSCHVVLFKQLGAWLFQGRLSDEHNFFIRKEHPTDDDIEELHVRTRRLYGGCPVISVHLHQSKCTVYLYLPAMNSLKFTI